MSSTRSGLGEEPHPCPQQGVVWGRSPTHVLTKWLMPYPVTSIFFSGCTPEPSEVALVVDGETDLCSRGEDVNFELLGFSVYGQVCVVCRVIGQSRSQASA